MSLIIKNLEYRHGQQGIFETAGSRTETGHPQPRYAKSLKQKT
jgi:hypothetical protein